jgi:VWFA-related protein
MIRFPILLSCLLLFVSLSPLTAAGQAADVTLRFAVLDNKNEAYAGLKPEDIRVSVNKREIQPKSLTFFREKPLQILILVDGSVSQERTLPDEKRVAEKFIDQVLKLKGDQVAITKFTYSVYLVHDLSADLAAAKTKLREIEFEAPPGYVRTAIPALIIGPLPKKTKDPVQPGMTSIFDSVIKAVSAFESVRSSGGSQKAILLISDGVNTAGEKKIKEAVDASIKANMPIFAVGMGDDFFGGIDKNTLKKLTESTGGIAVIPDKKLTNVPELLARIESVLRSGYELTFSSQASDSPVEISVEIDNPQLKAKDLQIVQPKRVFIKPR